jgi:GntR family transcriptional regulator, transcriptional repressor for pyruvate dehydrogenase complex
LLSVSVDARSPAYQVLAEDLREQITSGRLRPGDRLPTEPQLCQTSGLSRSTVREALRLLASQNLIVTTRGVAGGSFVIHPTPAKISEAIQTGVALLQASSIISPTELLEVRAVIEVPAAGLAARRRTEEKLTELKATLFDPRTADLETMVAVHHLFHRALAAACGNPLLELLAHPLQGLSNAMRLPENLGRDDWIRVDADHRAIFDAVLRRDSPAAERAAAAHLEYLGTILDRAASVGTVTDP